MPHGAAAAGADGEQPGRLHAPTGARGVRRRLQGRRAQQPGLPWRGAADSQDLLCQQHRGPGDGHHAHPQPVPARPAAGRRCIPGRDAGAELPGAGGTRSGAGGCHGHFPELGPHGDNGVAGAAPQHVALQPPPGCRAAAPRPQAPRGDRGHGERGAHPEGAHHPRVRRALHRARLWLRLLHGVLPRRQPLRQPAPHPRAHAVPQRRRRPLLPPARHPRGGRLAPPPRGAAGDIARRPHRIPGGAAAVARRPHGAPLPAVCHRRVPARRRAAGAAGRGGCAGGQRLMSPVNALQIPINPFPSPLTPLPPL